MPFRDGNQFTRAPGFAERWLRRVFIEDWSLKLLALAITLILWFVVSGHDVEREVTVQPSLEGKPAAAYEVKYTSRSKSATPDIAVVVDRPGVRVQVMSDGQFGSSPSTSAFAARRV